MGDGGHDDLWLPHHLSLLVAAIDGGAGLAYGITEMVGLGDSQHYHPPAARSPRPWAPSP